MYVTPLSSAAEPDFTSGWFPALVGGVFTLAVFGLSMWMQARRIKTERVSERERLIQHALVEAQTNLSILGMWRASVDSDLPVLPPMSTSAYFLSVPAIRGEGLFETGRRPYEEAVVVCNAFGAVVADIDIEWKAWWPAKTTRAKVGKQLMSELPIAELVIEEMVEVLKRQLSDL